MNANAVKVALLSLYKLCTKLGEKLNADAVMQIAMNAINIGCPPLPVQAATALPWIQWHPLLLIHP